LALISFSREDTGEMSGDFLSYRQEDAAGFAARIYDRLTKNLGRESVFIDVDNIPRVSILSMCCPSASDDATRSSQLSATIGLGARTRAIAAAGT
jgi:hypothetical protein